ncbi:MAG: hypothetical protein AAGH40_12945 [Verrucomicrobiota bacterium]
MFGELDDEDRVFSRQSNEHDESDLGEDVVVETAEDNEGDATIQVEERDLIDFVCEDYARLTSLVRPTIRIFGSNVFGFEKDYSRLCAVQPRSALKDLRLMKVDWSEAGKQGVSEIFSTSFIQPMECS